MNNSPPVRPQAYQRISPQLKPMILINFADLSKDNARTYNHYQE